MFSGYVQLEDTLKLVVLLRDPTQVPVNPDSLANARFRVYGPAGVVSGYAVGATPTYKDSGSVTAASNANPIVITSVAHGLDNNFLVTVAGVGGNTAANGTFTVANKATDTFELSGSTGNGDYTTGGTWNVTGLLLLTIDATAANGFEAGYTYDVLLECAVGAVNTAVRSTFIVT